jgi:hypothetical protein
MNLTSEDAKYLLGGFGVLVVFVVTWLPTLKLSDYIKFAIVAVLSAIGGYLTLVSTEQILTSGSLIQNGSLVFAASQAFYYVAFRALGLERVLFPQNALVKEAQEQAKDATPTNISTAVAKDILDPNTSPKLEATVQVTNSAS